LQVIYTINIIYFTASFNDLPVLTLNYRNQKFEAVVNNNLPKTPGLQGIKPKTLAPFHLPRANRLSSFSEALP
jgi:hypothetical protein